MKIKKVKNVKNKKEESPNIMNNESMKLFTMLASYFLIVLVLYSTFQLIKFNNCLGLIQILSITIPIIAYLLLNKNKDIKKQLITISIYIFLLLVLPFLYNKTYDLTVDGNSYHKTAIAFIKNGWNPLYETSTEFQKNNNKIVPFEESTRINLWIEHYPKATWITAATIYNMTGNIESGKCVTLISSIMLIIIAYNCLSQIIKSKYALAISILIALNPITLSQMFSYYVDSLMGILFAIELFLLFLIKPMEKQNNLIWIALAGICALFVNIKFTGLMSSGLIAAVFYFYWFFKHRKEQDFFKKFGIITRNFIIVFVTAIALVGANSYIKNTIEHHNPLYPLIGKDKVDIITTMQPKSFGKKNALQKFAISLFSKTQNVTYEMSPTLKWPIRVYRSEIGELYASDVRIGGFGPLFALSIIVSTIMLIVNLIIFIKHESKNLKYIIIPALSIFISMILLGESWWARYVPQFYLYVIGTIVLTLYNEKYYQKNTISKLSAALLSAIVLLNATCFLYINYKELRSFNEITNDLKVMKNTKDLKIKLGTEDLYGYYYNLQDNNIKYQVVKEIEEKNQRYKYSWRIVVEEK